MRISIVVPYLGNDSAFEESLVSVLENRPGDAEICVVHDGSYCDPFELGDEVRFITAPAADLPSLIAAATAVAQGRFVHLIGEGVRATHGWTEAALRQFEHDDAAVVAPVARVSEAGTIVAAGWTDALVGVTAPLGAGKKTLGRRDAAAIRGAYLNASFWRKPELQAAIEGLCTTDPVAAEFAWTRLLTAAGWRCVLADESTVVATAEALLPRRSFARGLTLRALAAEIDERPALPTVVLAGLGSLFSPAAWGQTLGQAAALVKQPAAVRGLRFDRVHSPGDTADTLSMPTPVAQMSPRSLQRAA